jgi:hypothetical protein
VEDLKTAFKKEPVMIRSCLPCEVVGYDGRPEDFTSAMLSLEYPDVKLQTHGGNHQREAVASLYKRAVEAGHPLNLPVFCNVPVVVYFNLTNEEALSLARQDNQIHGLYRSLDWFVEICVIRKIQQWDQQEDATGITAKKMPLSTTFHQVFGTDLPTVSSN